MHTKLLPLAVVLLAGCPARENPPTGFGVNLTISRAALPAADRDRITNLDLSTFGAETFTTRLPVSFFKELEGRVRYVPKVMTGSLTFVVQALDGSGTIVASARQAIDLAAPSNVDLKLELGAPLKTDGSSCGSSNECASQAGCVDGVCCKTACPSCRACAAGTGECTTVVASAADPDSCNGSNVCDASGVCKKVPGETCAAAGECASNVCADGVCCTAACDGTCRSCNLPNNVGTCTAVVNAEDPDTCATSAANGVNVCNDVGVCITPHLVTDVNTSPITAGTASSLPAEFRSLANGLTFFRASTAAGTEPWVSDGTPGGTMLLKDIAGVAGNSTPTNFTALAGTMYFIATDSDGVRKLWKSDGTTAGTVVVKEPAAGGPILGFSNSGLVVFQNQLFFAAQGNVAPTFGNGVELWKSDGTAAGTSQVQDFLPGNFSTSPRSFAVVGNRLLFVGASSVMLNPAANVQQAANEELLGTDGNSIMVVKDVLPDSNFPSNSSISSEITLAGGKGYFTAFSPTLGTELWVTDGTGSNTFMVKDIALGNSSSSPRNLVAAKGQLYFTALENSTGLELYRTDGTMAGTAMVADILAGAGSGDPGPVEGVAGGDIFFSAIEQVGATSKRSLYRSDGISTAQVVSVSGAPSVNPSSLTAFGGRLWFGAFNDMNQYELWVLDPSSTGAIAACRGTTGCFMQNVGNFSSVIQVRSNRIWFPADTKVPNTGGVGFEPFVFP